MLDIVIENEHWKKLRGLQPATKRAVAATLNALQLQKQLTILFADDATLQALNTRWRGKNMPTNVLSFAASRDLKWPRGAARPLGDIALAFETVVREAQASGKTLKDHTSHLVVHGILHLLGYDHDNTADAAKMEAREIRILKKLGIADPYQ